jgi:class 3 adenylate cyclase
LRLVEAQVTAELDRLQVFWKDLNAMTGAFHVSQSVDEVFAHYAGSEIVPSHWRELIGELVNRRQQLVAALDRDIEEKLGVGPHKLRWYLTEGHPIHIKLPAQLRAAARQLILLAMQNVTVSRLGGNAGEPVESSDYRQCVAAARPILVDQAAGTRLLLIVPQDIDPAAGRRSLATEHEDATIVSSTGGDFIACQEAELLEVRRVAARLVDHRPALVEIAKRLHTRIDVPWHDMSAGSPDSD